MDEYDLAAKRWARGMRAAAPFIQERQKAQRAVMIHNRAAGALRPCAIKGCKRHTYKHRLCRKHYDMVPHELRRGVMIACMEATIRAAKSFDARYVREVQALVKESAAPSA